MKTLLTCALATLMFASCNQPKEQIERICWLVAHHHTYHASDDMDYQILIEADFLVNLYEDNESADAIRAVRKNIFRTQSGLKILDDMFNINNG